VKKKFLNLYGGIGGNVKLLDRNEFNITTVELDENIASVYRDMFPNDTLIIGDAHQYLLENFDKFDFIWASPPCPTHSKLRTLNENKVFPDMKLYEEIIFLKHWFKGKYVVENVEPYYDYLIKATRVIHRHPVWCNFEISNKQFKNLKTCKIENEREFLEKEFGYDLSKYKGIDKRKVLRNCVVPELGKHIVGCAFGKNTIEEGYLF